MVEAAGSRIEKLLPKSIHVVTSQGLELKVALFVIAYSLDCYFKPKKLHKGQLGFYEHELND